MSQKAQKKMSYEQAVSRLEEIAQLLQDSGRGLEGSMALFEESVKLSTYCYQLLEEYQGKIKVLTENGEQDFEHESF